MFRKESVFEKINKYLHKRGHELVMSLLFDEYNGNQIYIRVDYVPKISVYKIVWVDLNFFDEKNIGDYLNVQMMTKFMADRLVNIMLDSKYESGIFEKKGIIGDRVEIISYLKEDRYDFIFDRYLPLELKFLIDPLVIIFSYLPKGMECILNEIFGKFDGLEEMYDLAKPFKFKLMKDSFEKIFKKPVIDHGYVALEDGRISFLEKVKDRYIAIVEDKNPVAVYVRELEGGHVRLFCSCNEKGACYHMAAVMQAIRRKKSFNNFYKVKLIDDSNDNLFDKITNAAIFLCFGITEDKLLLVSENGTIFEEPICSNGKVRFEVIEDDDEMSLSEVLEGYKK